VWLNIGELPLHMAVFVIFIRIKYQPWGVWYVHTSHMGKPKYNWTYVEFSLDWKFWCDTVLCWYGWSDMIHFFGGYYTIVALALLVEPPCTQLAVKTKKHSPRTNFQVSRVCMSYICSILIHSDSKFYGDLWSIVQFIHLDMSGELWDGNHSFPKLWGPINLQGLGETCRRCPRGWV